MNEQKMADALQEIRELIDGMADTQDVPDSNEVRPNIFMRIDSVIATVLGPA